MYFFYSDRLFHPLALRHASHKEIVLSDLSIHDPLPDAERRDRDPLLFHTVLTVPCIERARFPQDLPFHTCKLHRSGRDHHVSSLQSHIFPLGRAHEIKHRGPEKL